MFEIIQDVLPSGVANVISGFGEEAGKPLCEHPLVRKITFTGSSAVGAQIMHYAADKFISVTAELGGKNPNIIMPDADLDLAVAGIVQGLRLFRQGQSCTAGTRVYIHEDIYDQVLGASFPLSAKVVWAIRSTTLPKLASSSPPSN